MKQREKIKNPEPRSLSQVLKDCHNLVDELRVKLKLKCDEILKLRKELDLAREETQLAELKYNKLNDAVEKEANDRLNKIRGVNND
jgi:hypothetical protein|tara:strand:+ start:141 stop:398 length:258 start_codon:yes stop_codon:yes gene_type:complete